MPGSAPRRRPSSRPRSSSAGGSSPTGRPAAGRSGRPGDVADRLVLQMGRLEREELRVVLLNTKNVVLRVATVYQGNVSSSLVRVGELFRDAVRLNAAGLILVHNHPIGRPDAVAGRPPPDRRGARRRPPARHRPARPSRRRPRRVGLAPRPRRLVRSPGPAASAALSAARGPAGAAGRAGYTARASPPDPERAIPRCPSGPRGAAANTGRDPTRTKDLPATCSTASSASSPATSGSTSGPPTRWSTSATAGS